MQFDLEHSVGFQLVICKHRYQRGGPCWSVPLGEVWLPTHAIHLGCCNWYQVQIMQIKCKNYSTISTSRSSAVTLQEVKNWSSANQKSSTTILSAVFLSMMSPAASGPNLAISSFLVIQRRLPDLEVLECLWVLKYSLEERQFPPQDR